MTFWRGIWEIDLARGGSFQIETRVIGVVRRYLPIKEGNRVRGSSGVLQEEGKSKGMVAKEIKNKGISSLMRFNISHIGRYLVYNS